jgi:hypothetical protein
METQKFDYTAQIEEASKKAKSKLAFYLYDEAGNRQLLGIFSKNRANEIRKHLRTRNLINKLTEFEVKTTEPDTNFNLS